MNVLTPFSVLICLSVQLTLTQSLICKCFSYGYHSTFSPNLGDTSVASNNQPWICDSSSTCTPESGYGCITIRTQDSLIGFCGRSIANIDTVRPYLPQATYQDQRTICSNLAIHQNSYCECNSGNYCNYPVQLREMLSAAPNLHPKVYLTLAVAVILAKLL